jgi:hypothetical protein
MKHLRNTTVVPFLIFVSICQAHPSALLFDFGPTPLTMAHAALSPGHSIDLVPPSDIRWNTIDTSAANMGGIVYANGNASDIKLTVGQEAIAGSNSIDFKTPITGGALTAVKGSGGGSTVNHSLLHPGSIYGENPSLISAGGDGFIGNGAPLTDGRAIGLRVDGLPPATYIVFVMARNTNSNSASYPMNIAAAVGAPADSFPFGGLASVTEKNTSFPTSHPANPYSTFVEGENYVALKLTVAAGQSLYLAVDSSNNLVDTRGFLNMIQIIPAPAPTVQK